jgi:hypothetical protein
MSKKDLPKGTAAPATPDVIAFTTAGDPRVYSAQPMSTLFGLVARDLGAGKSWSVGGAEAARKTLIKQYPLDPATLVPERRIGRVIFCGHAGPENSVVQSFAFAGTPPANNNPHHFLWSKDSALMVSEYETEQFLDALAERLVPNASIWFITCYAGYGLVPGVAKMLKAKKAPGPTAAGYNGEIGFKWLPADPPKPATGIAVKANLGVNMRITTANQFFDVIA